MGGGDLNLKKSWHPSTFQNLEKVWKAEQRHDAEQKKIAQLQDELKEERAREDMQKTAEESGVLPKRDSRVDWLYSGPTSSVNREEYLLGKKIDKMVDPTLMEQQRESQALASGPGALFAAENNATADLAVKVREDPLFLIKQKEEAAKKQLASNPVKLKQLQQLVSERKSKSKKKHHHSRSSPKRKRKHSLSPPHQSSPQPHSPPSAHQHRHTSPHRHRHTSPHSHRHTSPHSRRHTSPHSHRHTSSVRNPSSHSSRRYNPYSRPVNRVRKQDSHTQSMDSKELERRRQEMMVAAQDHGMERKKRLRTHEEEARKEETDDHRKEQKRSFLDPLRLQSLTSSSSLGDRIHRNIHSVQRTAAKLDSNFMDK